MGNYGLRVDGCVPLLGRALIRPLRMHERTRGGVLIASNKPDINDMNRPDAAFFTAIGEIVEPGLPRTTEGGTEIPCPVVKGDRVLHFTERSIDIDVDGVEHTIVAHPGLIAKVEYEDPPEEVAPSPIKRVVEEQPILTPIE